MRLRQRNQSRPDWRLNLVHTYSQRAEEWAQKAIDADTLSLARYAARMAHSNAQQVRLMVELIQKP